MTPTSGSLSRPITLDYENTLVLSIELRPVAFWRHKFRACRGSRRNKQTIEPRIEALLAAIDAELLLRT